MKIQFLDNTNIRIDINDLSILPVGILFKGMIVEVEDSFYNGQEIDGVHTYFKDAVHNWYYWSGKAILQHQSLPSPTHQIIGTESDIVIPSKIELKYQEGNPHILTPDAEEIPQTDERGEETNFETADKISTTLEEKETMASASNISSFSPRVDQIFNEDQIPQLYWQAKKLSGKNVRIAVLDTGIAKEDQAGLTIVGAEDFVYSKESIHDTDGHGSLCAMLIGGGQSSAQLGLAPSSELLIGKIKTNADDKVDVGVLQDSIRWAVNSGAAVVFINYWQNVARLTIEQRIQMERLFLHYSGQGVIFVSPVGILNRIKPVEHFPGVFEGCLTVGAYDENKRAALSPARSKHLDILAPSGAAYFNYLSAGSGIAAAYTTGILALNLELKKRLNKEITSSKMIELVRQSALNKDNNGIGSLCPPVLLNLLEGLPLGTTT